MASLTDQSDADLAAAGRMLVAELEKVSIELARRGVTREITTWESGAIKMEFQRVITEVI